MATLFGGALALSWKVALGSLGVWLVTLITIDYMSVASILAASSAFLFSMLWDRSFVLHIDFGITPLIVIFTHLHNIGRLLHHSEPRFRKGRNKKDEDDEIVVAFAVHSRDLEDLRQSPLSAWICALLEKELIKERTARWLIAKGSILECAPITGIVTATGKKVRVLIMGIPLMPDMIMSPSNAKLVESFLHATAVRAQRRGAIVLGLGGLLSSQAKGGQDLQNWCKARGLTIQIDNGAAYTAAATIIAARQSTTVQAPLCNMNGAVIGAKGLIGYAVGKALEQEVKSLIGVVRDKRAVSLDQPKNSIRSLTPTN